MTRMTALSVIGCFLLACAGCGWNPWARPRLGEAQSTVDGSLEAMGGLKRWKSAGPFRADAVVTLYDEAGAAAANRHQQVIHIRRGRLQASAEVPGGRWVARANARGKVRFKANGAELPAGLKARLLAALPTVLHRLRGPLNLYGYGDRAGEVTRVRLDGRDLVRVAATGRRSGVRAYYFDARTNVLRFVTTGADRAGEDGTVTVYDYQSLPNGMAVPARLSVVKIGRHALVGDQPVLEVEYSNIRF